MIIHRTPPNPSQVLKKIKKILAKHGKEANFREINRCAAEEQGHVSIGKLGSVTNEKCRNNYYTSSKGLRP